MSEEDVTWTLTTQVKELDVYVDPFVGNEIGQDDRADELVEIVQAWGFERCPKAFIDFVSVYIKEPTNFTRIESSTSMGHAK